MDVAHRVMSNFANYVMTVDMFPVFFIAHFAIGNIMVREDSKHLGSKFPQKHPFTSWFCTCLTCLSGVFIANFLFGDSLLEVLQDNFLIGFFTIVWYLMNYSPFDMVYKLMTHPALFLTAAVLQECLRARFLYLGMQTAAKLYPKAPLIILMGGIIKGNGYGFIKMVERLIRGHWAPGTNEFMELSHFSKSGIIASLLFLFHYYGLINIPIEYLYLIIVIAFIVCRLIIMVGKVPDPLAVFGAPLSRFLFGSWEDEKPDKQEPQSKNGKNKNQNNGKSKTDNSKKGADKKKD